MRKLYEALIEKLRHQHSFKLVNTTHTFKYSWDKMPYKTTYTYMCQDCGKIKTVIIE